MSRVPVAPGPASTVEREPAEGDWPVPSVNVTWPLRPRPALDGNTGQHEARHVPDGGADGAHLRVTPCYRAPAQSPRSSMVHKDRDIDVVFWIQEMKLS